MSAILDWEIAVPEVPKDIRQALSEVREEIVRRIPLDEEGVDMVALKWLAAKIKIGRLIDQDPQLKEALNYRSDNWEELNFYWQQFLPEPYSFYPQAKPIEE